MQIFFGLIFGVPIIEIIKKPVDQSKIALVRL